MAELFGFRRKCLVQPGAEFQSLRWLFRWRSVGVPQEQLSTLQCSKHAAGKHRPAGNQGAQCAYCSEYLKLTAVGSVVAVIGASLCCIGPLMALLLGAGGLAAAAGLEKWRPLFLGVTFALLVAAWYLMYRKPKGEGCVQGPACEAKGRGTASRRVVWLATVVAIGLAALPLYAGVLARLLQPGRPAGSAPANGAALRVRITSMDCAACAVSIERMLAKAEGVARAKVSFKTKEAVIEYDPARISPDKIVEVIKETGFKAEPLTKNEKP